MKPEMTLEEAKNEIKNAVYQATGLFEELEVQGLITCNGHHMRQNMAAYAAYVLGKNWEYGK